MSPGRRVAFCICLLLAVANCSSEQSVDETATFGSTSAGTLSDSASADAGTTADTEPGGVSSTVAEEATSELSAAVTAISAESYIEELSRLRSFVPVDDLAGEQCGELSASDGTVQIDASGSILSSVTQQATPVPASDLRLIVHFGSGFPAFQCTDLTPEVREATIDQTWPASAAEGTFTVLPSMQCSTATLELRDVVAVSPAGDEIHVGDVSITNIAWQWWHPFECHVDLDRLPAIDTSTLTRSGGCDASVFWAANEAETTALIVRTTVTQDVEAQVIDLTTARDATSVQIRRGETVLAGICGEDTTVFIGTEIRATDGFVTAGVGTATGGACKRIAGFDLNRIYFDDRTILDIAQYSVGIDCS
jgi:hypothetical protein